MTTPAPSVALQAAVALWRTQHLLSGHRRDETAMGLQGAVYLASQVRPLWRVLELGSGFSTRVLREVARTFAPPALISTVDHSERWLAQTGVELEALGLPTTDLFTWDAWLKLGAAVGTFDLVFVDLDGTPMRLAEVERLCGWVASGGVLLLDDWHLPHYGPAMRVALELRGWCVTELPETTDNHGRFLARAERSE